MRFRFDRFTYDSRRRVLAGDDAALAVTPKALLLLEQLLEASPDPVAKDAIYARLWPGVFVETGNLHNLISELRGALGDEGHQMIRTMQRVGYAFAAPVMREPECAPTLRIGDDVIELFEGENIIGRERIGTPDVSRHHARITVAGSTVTLEDLDSKNGTFVGDRRVRGRVPLHDGDELVFGRTRAQLRLIDINAPTVTASPVSGSRG